MTCKSGLDVASFDASVRIQDDLFAHVNNTWVREHPIPEDKSRYGAFDRLREKSEAAMRVIIEEAAQSSENAERAAGAAASELGPATQKVVTCTARSWTSIA